VSLNRFATRRDATEPEILRALTQAGASYIVLKEFDLLVLFRRRLFMLDCKTKDGKPTKSQQELVDLGWPLVYVRTAEEALTEIGAL
jgi:hypothetical protein